jgi:hypothetical protein
LSEPANHIRAKSSPQNNNKDLVAVVTLQSKIVQQAAIESVTDYTVAPEGFSSKKIVIKKGSQN